jgi:hypothetical protein
LQRSEKRYVGMVANVPGVIYRALRLQRWHFALSLCQ